MLDPNPEEMRRIGYAAVDRIVAHLAGLGDLPVAVPPDPDILRGLVAEPLPRQGLGVDDALRRFFEDLLPRATLVNHPRFFAYVPGPGSYLGAVGSFCAAATNLFVGTWLGGSSMAQLELQVVDWLREAIGLPPEYGGVLTSGGSVANLSALAAARERARGAGVDLARARVYTSDATHDSMRKGAAVLGFAPAQCVEIAVDDHHRLDPRSLASQLDRDRAAGLAPIFVCATAGSTTTGAIDEIEQIASVCRESACWLHVDGAYGAAAALLAEHAPLRSALATADSITLDPHKWLYCPFECGTLLTRDLPSLEAAFAGDAAYMQDVPRDEVNFFVRGPELSRGNRALKLWFLLRSVGVDAIAERIREDCRLAAVARDRVAALPGVRIETELSLSIFTFTVGRAEDRDGSVVRQVVKRLIADGTTMLSSSRVGDTYVLRFCVANHRTTQTDVERATAALERVLTRL